MTDIEKLYFDNFKKVIDNVIPDFENTEEELRFYEIMKREGLNMASALISDGDSILYEIKQKFGSNSDFYKELSDEFVKIITDLIFVEINPNIIYIHASDVDILLKIKIAKQNQLGTSLLNKIGKYYKGDQNNRDIITLRNKITAIEKRFNPKSSCYIATIIYGSYTCNEVCILREFRDTYLESRFFGRIFVQLYYKSCFIFHPLVKNNIALQKVIKYQLDKIILRICS